MNRKEIMNKLIEIFKYTLSDNEEIIKNITEESNLYSDLGLSSVGMLYSVIAIEEVFEIDFGNVSFGNFTIVKDVIDFIVGKKNK